MNSSSTDVAGLTQSSASPHIAAFGLGGAHKASKQASMQAATTTAKEPMQQSRAQAQDRISHRKGRDCALLRDVRRKEKSSNDCGGLTSDE